MATIQARKGKKGVTYTATVRVAGNAPTSATFKRLGDAREWSARTETEIKEARYFDRRRVTLTVAEALKKYKEEVSIKKARTTQAREAVIITQLERSLGPGTLIINVTPAVVAAMRDSRLKKPVGSYTVRLELALLSDLYNVAAREWGHGGLKNPVDAVNRPAVPRGRTMFLTDDQSKALLAQCKKSRNRQLHAYVLTLLHTGMRPGEAAALQWRQINHKERYIELTDTKNGDIRRVPMTKTVTATLKRPKKPASEYVFLTPAKLNGKPLALIADKYFRQSWGYAREKAGMPKLHLHDLRHTAASHLLMAGVDLRTLAALLGHRTMQMVMRYTHLLDDHKQAAIDKLDSLGK